MITKCKLLRHLPKLLIALASTGASTDCQSLFAQQPTADSPANPGAAPQAESTWVVRDPATGRLYQQRFVSVTVPVTRMEPKTIEQPVYELQTEAKVQPVPQTIYKPTTQYVMQPKLRGWWNPVRQPVQAYEYIPVTSWQPQTEMVNQPTVSQRWVAKSQKIVVYQPVQATEVRQQLVQTELPQPPAVPAGIANNPTSYAANSAVNSGGRPAFLPTAAMGTTSLASQPVLPPPTAPRQPLISAPLLAQQRILPWPQVGVAAPASGLRPIMNTGPFGVAASQANYQAPLRTATSSADFSHRDSLQSGMQPTVLR